MLLQQSVVPSFTVPFLSVSARSILVWSLLVAPRGSAAVGFTCRPVWLPNCRCLRSTQIHSCLQWLVAWCIEPSEKERFMQACDVECAASSGSREIFCCNLTRYCALFYCTVILELDLKWSILVQISFVPVVAVGFTTWLLASKPPLKINVVSTSLNYWSSFFWWK